MFAVIDKDASLRGEDKSCNPGQSQVSSNSTLSELWVQMVDDSLKTMLLEAHIVSLCSILGLFLGSGSRYQVIR